MRATWRRFDARSEADFQDRNSSKNSCGNECTTSGRADATAPRGRTTKARDRLVLELGWALPVAVAPAYDDPMNGDKVWTADELERMAPDERSRLFNERVVTDLSTLPPEFVARIRAKGRALLAERGIVAPEA